MTPRKLGHYRILRELGAGGMGRVYLAEDTKLGRRVALKVLPDEMALDDDRLRRFRREAESLASLDHPNIVTIYSIEEADDATYLTMTWVDGETVASLLPPGGFEIDRLLHIGAQLAEALDAAHARGVTHRDLKPGNIMVTAEGRVYVLDFGLAKIATAAGTRTATVEGVTAHGTILGTFPYMSPEQARGEPVGSPSDIFSLGAVLYEMATGQRPFRGATEGELIASILRDTPPSAFDLRRDLPIALDLTLGRCLQKEPSSRPSAAELGTLLRDLARSGASRAAKSIAVLPFTDMSAEGDQRYFCDGIAEEILNALSQLDSLRVAARTSSFLFRDHGGDIREIGRRLGVETILEGSVRKSGDRIRVTAQLVGVADGYRVWSERYDRELTDVFAIQDSIAESIVDALEIALTPQEQRTLAERPRAELAAYEQYLRGRHYLHEMTRESIRLALQMFRKASRIDPAFAPAYAGIAEAHGMLYHWAGRSDADLEEAERASRRAVELSPGSAEAHAARGHVLSLHRRREEAARSFERAMRLNPSLYEPYYYAGIDRIHEGDFEGASQLLRRAAEIREEDYNALDHLRMAYVALGRNAEAAGASEQILVRVDRYLDLHPDDPRALQLGALALRALGRVEEGRDWIERALSLQPDDPRTWYNAVCFYAQTGRTDLAFDYFERVIDADFGLREWLERDSDLATLRADPRFRELSKSFG